MGHLVITWTVSPPDDRGKPWLHIDWRESGVQMAPADALPRVSGQGRELIEQALAISAQCQDLIHVHSRGRALHDLHPDLGEHDGDRTDRLSTARAVFLR